MFDLGMEDFVPQVDGTAWSFVQIEYMESADLTAE